VLSLGAALVATLILVKQKMASSLTPLLLLASVILLLGPFGVRAYWNRPEPFLILVGVLALVMAFKSPSLVAAVGIGVLAGLAAGLKLYGFIYTVPAAAAAIAKVDTRRGRFVMAIIGIVCALGSAFLPYLGKGASVADYLLFLRVAIDDGWSVPLLTKNLLFVSVLAAPFIVIWIWQKPTLNPADRWVLFALVVSTAIITIIGAKAGGGTYYFVPLIPICIYGIAVVVLASCKASAKEIVTLIFMVLFIAYGPHLFLYLLGLQSSHQAGAETEREQIAELKAYLSSYPEAQIGISDDSHYSNYFYRTFSVWDGRPLHVDFTVWVDLAYAGVDEEHIERFIEGCTVPAWILPLGEPFAKVSWYNYLPMVSEKFRKKFLANYRQVKTGRAYQVWECKSQ
jgi:hypothetical protein